MPEPIPVPHEVVVLAREIAGHIRMANEQMSVARAQLALAEEKLLGLAGLAKASGNGSGSR